MREKIGGPPVASPPFGPPLVATMVKQDIHPALKLGSLLLAFLTIFAFPALGQNPEPHERFDQYYQTWKQPGMYGLSCCNANEYVDTLSGRMHIAGDCEPTRAEIRNGHWWARVPQYMIEAGVPTNDSPP